MTARRRVKFPRIPHLPWSPGRSGDDVAIQGVDRFCACPDLIVTEKLDGENTTLYADYFHARSTTYSPHPSRSWLARFHAAIGHEIPKNFRICGENLFAQHSIRYEALPSYFVVFSIFNETSCLSWDETVAWCNEHGLWTAPVLYRGLWDEERIKGCWTGVSLYGGEQEGYVVRDAGYLATEEYGCRTAKYVRPGHVQTDDHWMSKPVVVNGLASC